MERLCPPGEGQASYTAPPVTGGETEAQRPSAHCWGPWVCRGPLRLPRTPADPGKACAQTPRCPSPHRGAFWPRVPGGMCVCTAVDSEGWSRGLAVEALPSPEQSQACQYPAPGGHGHPSPPSLEWEQGVRVTTGQRPGRHGPSLPIPRGQHRVELSRSPRGLEARATLLCLHVLEQWVSL